eukprot:8872882-Pyramimonas_sp.AAC.1
MVSERGMSCTAPLSFTTLLQWNRQTTCDAANFSGTSNSSVVKWRVKGRGLSTGSRNQSHQGRGYIILQWWRGLTRA